MSKGTIDKFKGRTKEAAGAVFGDRKLKREGQADQFVGKVKDGAEKVKDGAEEVVEKTKDTVKGR